MAALERVFLSIECALVLFACAAGPAAFQLWRHGAESPGGYLTVIGIPATAALMFVGACAVIPGLLAVGRLAFPLPLTLPIVFSSFVLVGAVLWTTAPVGLIRDQGFLSLGKIWEQPGPLIISTAGGILGLILLGALQGVSK